MNKSNKPQMRYTQKNIKHFNLSVNMKTEKEIYDKLLISKPYTTYIKDLIKKDMEAQKKNADK